MRRWAALHRWAVSVRRELAYLLGVKRLKRRQRLGLPPAEVFEELARLEARYVLASRRAGT